MRKVKKPLCDIPNHPFENVAILDAKVLRVESALATTIIGEQEYGSAKSKTLVVSHEGFDKAGDNLLSRYSHYHGPQMLNGRVRNGNGCVHLGMVTGKTHVAQPVYV